MSSPTQAQVDENYRRKLAGRRDGTTPVLLILPEPKDIKGNSPQAIDERYRAKMRQREAAATAQAVVENAATADEQPKAESPKEESKGGEQKSGKPDKGR